MARRYTAQSVLDAAQERVSLVFDRFENITVSVSGGKDSTALYHLMLAEAARRHRKIGVMYLDQEAEYQSTIDLIAHMMSHPLVRPMWYQVPIRMTNATSYEHDFLYAWGDGEAWMRPKHPVAIQSIADVYPQRFYDFFNWLEKTTPDTAFVIGLRAEESLNRLRSVIKNPGIPGINWSTKTKGPTTFRMYPIYDWGMGDVWRFIDENALRYNAIYDRMLAANHNFYNTMRVSCLIHEKSMSCLTSLQELEPDTYDRLIARLGGVHVAARYAKDSLLFSASRLPEMFGTWREYRDYLLATAPIKHRARFEKRFAGQEQSEAVYRQQCRQIMTNDYENSLAPTQNRASKRESLLAPWRDIL